MIPLGLSPWYQWILDIIHVVINKAFLPPDDQEDYRSIHDLQG